jgi:diguanylate cyclase
VPIAVTSRWRSLELRLAEKMREAVNALRVPWAEHSLAVGVTIGVVEIDASLPDLAAVLAAADQACCAAKHSGRDCVRVHGVAVLRVV